MPYGFYVLASKIITTPTNQRHCVKGILIPVVVWSWQDPPFPLLYSSAKGWMRNVSLLQKISTNCTSVNIDVKHLFTQATTWLTVLMFTITYSACTRWIWNRSLNWRNGSQIKHLSPYLPIFLDLTMQIVMFFLSRFWDISTTITI